jgi:hypothetical protein
MGYYIETAQPKNKAAAIRQDLNAIEITVDEAEFFIKEQMGAVICVVNNGPFEAAAYCYNLDEFRAFNYDDDDRPKTWLLVEDVEKVHEVTGYKGALAR